MQCPVCKNVSLVISERQSIEIDYCPQCRGVWLDRGELDKIIERASSVAEVAESRAVPHAKSHEKQHQEHRDYDDDRHSGHGYRKKKRSGFLGELFDFD
ncbi:MAG: zf-TFIIB domain-containing protein [Gammaproteobacteria bacterium]|nr:zf-TFIIB domain-containing protein [Gammaproteobacteria bacterium]